MSSSSVLDPVGCALFPKSRREVLHLLYGHPDRAYYVREIVRSTGLGYGHVQRELARLRAGGILTRTEQGRHVYFQANPECAIYEELRGLITKTVGATGHLRTALSTLGALIDVAFIYGSVARHEEKETSDLDLMVIGDVSLKDVVAVLRGVESSLGREITPMVYSRDEAQTKQEDHFLRTVLKGEKIFILGSNRDLPDSD